MKIVGVACVPVAEIAAIQIPLYSSSLFRVQLAGYTGTKTGSTLVGPFSGDGRKARHI